jgi:uncharacterized protein YkwD
MIVPMAAVDRHGLWNRCSPVVRLLAAICAIAVLACQPPPEHTESVTPVMEQPTPATVADPDRAMTIKLPGAAAESYIADPSQASQTVLARRIRQRFPQLEVVPCLERAAAALAAVDAMPIDRLPLSFSEFVLHWAGCPDPTATVSALLTDSDNDNIVFAELASLLEDGGFTHVGVARAPAQAPYRYRWILLLVNRRFGLKAVPTSGEPGQYVPLQFRVDAEFRSARFVVTHPRGETVEITAGLSGGWAVAGLPLAEDVGRQWIELLAEGDQGPQVLALFPIEVGRSPPSLWVGHARDNEAWVATTAQAEQLAFELVTRDRAGVGLPALEPDEELAVIARSHSTDMAAGRYLAHVSPTSGTVTNRLREAGYRVRFAAENLAQGPTITEAHESLMRSPGHRAAILSPTATHLGIGVVRGSGLGEEEVYVITQLFTRPLKAADPLALTRGINDAIVRQRLSRGAPPSRSNVALARVAEEVASALARGELGEAGLQAAVNAGLADGGFAGRGWQAVFGSAHEMEDIALPEQVEDRAASEHGVGVHAPSEEAPATYVVLLVER